MKYFNKLLIAVFVLTLSINILNAQERKVQCLDTINIYIDDILEVTFATCKYDIAVDELQSDLNKLSEIVKSNKPAYKSYTLNYSPNKTLTVIPSNPIEKIILKDDGQQFSKFDKQCNINTPVYKLKVNFNKQSDLFSEQLVESIKRVIDTTEVDQRRFAKSYHYSINKNAMVYNDQLSHVNGELDMIVLKLGAGASLIKNQPVTDISGEIGFRFVKKGILKNEFYVSSNQFFLFDENQNVNTNSFINLGYRRNFSREFNNPNWLGVELGYLVARDGDFFDKNTFKVGFNWEIGKYVSVAPQLYISDGFDKVSPGIRVGFGF